MKTLEELVNAVDRALDMGTIRKADFDIIKNRLSRLYEKKFIDSIRERFTYGGKWEGHTEQELELIDSIPYNLTQFPSKKMLRLLNALLDSDPSNEVANTIKNEMGQWETLSSKLRELKGMIVTGRRKLEPSERKTKIRTLDNTGTCSVCGRNVKLSNGNIVDHGYKVYFGRNGSCFGTGYPPVEVSKEGIVAFRDMLVQDMFKTKERIKTLSEPGDQSTFYVMDKRITPEHKNYDRLKKRYIEDLERMIERFEREIELQNKRIAEWKPSDLPS